MSSGGRERGESRVSRGLKNVGMFKRMMGNGGVDGKGRGPVGNDYQVYMKPQPSKQAKKKI